MLEYSNVLKDLKNVTCRMFHGIIHGSKTVFMIVSIFNAVFNYNFEQSKNKKRHS